MKILLLSNLYPTKDFPYYGTFVKNFYEGLIKRNIKVEKVTLKKTNKKIKKLINYFKFFIDSIFKLFKGSYDIIYIHYVSHSGLPLLFYRPKNKMVVCNIHGTDLLPKKHKRIKKYLCVKILNKSDLIVVPSNYYYEIINKNEKIKNKNIIISPSGGIDSRIFYDMNNRSNEKINIGYVSRIEPDKGWDTFIDAIAKLNKENYQFFLVGEGSQRPEMDMLIAKYDFGDSLTVLPLLNQHELNEYFNKMNIFVFPSRSESESLGLVGLEAMAAGTILIGANNGGIATYLKNEKNGFIFDKNSSNDLASKIEYVSKLNLDEILKIKKNAKATAVIEYGSEQIMDNLIKVLKNDFKK